MAAAKRLAVVLSGGGVAGMAWETGILKGIIRSLFVRFRMASCGIGLEDHDIDLTGADLFVGSSAGSVVAAQLATGCKLATLYAHQTRAFDANTEKMPPTSLWAFIWSMTKARLWPPFGTTHEARMARVGRDAMQAVSQRDQPTDDERMATILALLPVREWPERKQLLVTAIDCETGKLVSWNKSSGVSLPLAVLSSRTIPVLLRPVIINHRPYMDGGIGSIANAHLAHGYERVVIVSTGRTSELNNEIAVLEASGSRVLLIVPDTASSVAMFPNPIDPRRRQSSALKGFAQAANGAASVRTFMTTPTAAPASAQRRRSSVPFAFGLAALLVVIVGLLFGGRQR
jgi:NTE family protein